MQTISDIARHTPPNGTKLYRVYFCFQQSVSYAPVAIDTHNNVSKVAGKVVLSADVLHEAYFTPNTARFRETSKISEQGKLYEQTLSFDIPKDRIAVTNTLQAIADNKLLIVYEDQNDVNKLLQNMRMESVLEVGRGNKYRITLKGKTTKPAKFMVGTKFGSDLGNNMTLYIGDYLF